MRNTERWETQLKVIRTRLTRHLRGIEDSLDDPAPRDPEDRASERQGDEVLEAMGQHDLRELRMVEAALVRLEDGSFGDCTRCGAEISDERLNLLPFTPVCKRCAREIDAH